MRLGRRRLLALHRLTSWLLAPLTAAMLATGYSMTFLGVDRPLLRVTHFAFDLVFTPTLLVHVFLSLGAWRRSGTGFLSRGAGSPVGIARLAQRLSALALLLGGLLMVATGLDWFKMGLGRLLPYPLHRRIDLLVSAGFGVHLSSAAYLSRVRNPRRPAAPLADTGRREALKAMVGGALAVAASLVLQRAPKVGLPTGSAPGVLPPGQTEVEALKVLHTGIGIPPWDPETWRLRVVGEVENPLELTYGEVRTLPSEAKSSDFHCVTGWSKLGNLWEGVTVAHLLDLAKPTPKARYVTFECLRGYTTSLPIPELYKEGVMLAYRLDGGELPREHGGPLRLVVPHKYGYKSAKWVATLRVTQERELGYWEQRGYSDTANPWTNDRYSDN